MARLNIEDQFFLDITDVIAKVGDQDKAIGNAIRWLRHAQEKHKQGRVLSEEEFLAQGFSEALIPLFATRTATGIMAVGAEKHFAWLKKKVDAGRKGGRSKSEAKLKNLKQYTDSSEASPKQNRSTPKHKEGAKSEAQPKQTEAKGSIPEASYYKGGSSEPATAIAIAAGKPDRFIAGYCERFKAKYGFNPDVTGKEAGIAKRVTKDMSAEKVEIYLDAFFSLPDPWLIKRRHPMEAFEAKKNELAVFAQNGDFMTNRQAIQADDMVSNLTLLAKVRKEQR